MMTKRTHVITILALAFLLILGMSATAFAADTETSGSGYTYRVTIYSGQQGAFSDDATTWKKEYQAGASISISLEDLGFTLKDKKYYVRGFRVAGHDNDETTGIQRLQIDKIDTDVTYELAYGIKGAMVSYTVNYVDADGKKLWKSDVYYGMPGDKPVVSYRYIDGYYPNAYNLAKTLSEDESKNVFNFTYTKGTPPETETETIVRTVQEPGTPAANANTARPGNPAAGAAAPGTAANPAGTAAPGQGANDGGNGVTIGDGDTPLAGPQQYADLDDNDTPLAGGPGSSLSKRTLLILIGSGIVLVAGVILILLALLRRRKNQAEEVETDAAQA